MHTTLCNATHFGCRLLGRLLLQLQAWGGVRQRGEAEAAATSVGPPRKRASKLTHTPGKRRLPTCKLSCTSTQAGEQREGRVQ